MKVHQIPFQQTGYFSNLICDYLAEEAKLSEFYGNFPNVDGFKQQIRQKSSFDNSKRASLFQAVARQNTKISIGKRTQENINILQDKDTFTVTTGHQLNIFTGPLYFIYKIATTINLAKELKDQFPLKNFVPVFWMATEDHDFEEIKYFNFKNHKIAWNKDATGPVGRLSTKGLHRVFEEFSKLLGHSTNAKYLKDLFKKSYLEHSRLAEATRFLVNELFGSYGLVIIDGDDTQLKREFIPLIRDELLNQSAYKEVLNTNNKLAIHYKIQVNPREMNLFYLKNGLRERIVLEGTNYRIKNTNTVFSKKEILLELDKYPERFSPNAIVRPLYQETVLPNLCYIGGGGELAYWFQLKRYFEKVATPFPVLLLRNSVLFMKKRQFEKLQKLNMSLTDIFLNQAVLTDKKVTEISEISIDFEPQRRVLKKQFNDLKELSNKTDVSFAGAVNAQEKKQLNGLDVLEKRLLKAQKRKLSDHVNRLQLLQDELFPNQSLEERSRNFSELYLEQGAEFIKEIITSLNPLIQEFSVLEH